MIVGVLIELAHKNIDRIFDYIVPTELENSIKIGIRVEVPFGHQQLEGFVLDIISAEIISEYEFKKSSEKEAEKATEETKKSKKTKATKKVSEVDDELLY